MKTLFTSLTVLALLATTAALALAQPLQSAPPGAVTPECAVAQVPSVTAPREGTTLLPSQTLPGMGPGGAVPGSAVTPAAPKAGTPLYQGPTATYGPCPPACACAPACPAPPEQEQPQLPMMF